MKKLLLVSGIMLATACLFSCNRENGNQGTTPDAGTEEGFHAVARMSVPCGTKEVMVETYALDSKGNKTDVAYQKVAVTPKVEAPKDGKDVEPFGEVDLLLQAPNQTLVSVYYTVKGIVPAVDGVKSAADEDRTLQAQYVIEGLPVDQPGSGVATKADGDPITVELPEPASYITHDADQTMYQSSGVVMFEDSWPKLSGNINDEDYNDVVVDYDVTALTVADHLLEAEGWREQVKVVLHVRAVSGDEPYRVGMVLENFDMHNVEKVTEYKTLDSYNSGHGNLPEWSKVTLQENSLHYDPLATEYANEAWTRPAVEIGRLNVYRQEDRGAGTEVYTYTNNGETTEHVMNPALRQWESVWNGPHKEQYTLDGADLTKAQAKKYYNVIPGYVNVAGGLYTYTVVYEMKSRADMTAEQREAVKKNMIDAVVKTTSQNFYIVKHDYSPVGLKGYAPYDLSVKNYADYSARYKTVCNQNKDHLSADTYYKGINGEVWGFKCPTLTKHIWNQLGFGKAYPHYKEWVSSNGELYPDWYVNEVEGKYLTCWW